MWYLNSLDISRCCNAKYVYFHCLVFFFYLIKWKGGGCIEQLIFVLYLFRNIIKVFFYCLHFFYFHVGNRGAPTLLFHTIACIIQPAPYCPRTHVYVWWMAAKVQLTVIILFQC